MNIQVRRMLASAAMAVAANTAFSAGNLEIPAAGSTQSGITAISGWHCTATRIEIAIDNGPKMLAGSRSRNATCS